MTDLISANSSAHTVITLHFPKPVKIIIFITTIAYYASLHYENYNFTYTILEILPADIVYN